MKHSFILKFKSEFSRCVWSDQHNIFIDLTNEYLSIVHEKHEIYIHPRFGPGYLIKFYKDQSNPFFLRTKDAQFVCVKCKATFKEIPKDSNKCIY